MLRIVALLFLGALSSISAYADGWEPWLTGNTNGSVKSSVCPNNGWARGLAVRLQSSYGLIDVALKCSYLTASAGSDVYLTAMAPWATGNPNADSYLQSDAYNRDLNAYEMELSNNNVFIYSISLLEQYGYGLVVAHAITGRTPTLFIDSASITNGFAFGGGYYTEVAYGPGNPPLHRGRGDGYFASCSRFDERISRVQVREQGGYGVVDLRVYCKGL